MSNPWNPLYENNGTGNNGGQRKRFGDDQANNFSEVRKKLYRKKNQNQNKNFGFVSSNPNNFQGGNGGGGNWGTWNSNNQDNSNASGGGGWRSYSDFGNNSFDGNNGGGGSGSGFGNSGPNFAFNNFGPSPMNDFMGNGNGMNNFPSNFGPNPFNNNFNPNPNNFVGNNFPSGPFGNNDFLGNGGGQVNNRNNQFNNGNNFQNQNTAVVPKNTYTSNSGFRRNNKKRSHSGGNNNAPQALEIQNVSAKKKKNKGISNQNQDDGKFVSFDSMSRNQNESLQNPLNPFSSFTGNANHFKDQRPVTDGRFKSEFGKKFIIYETRANGTPVEVIQRSSHKCGIQFKIVLTDSTWQLILNNNILVCQGSTKKDVLREGLLRLKQFCYTIRHKVEYFSNFETITGSSLKLKSKQEKMATEEESNEFNLDAIKQIIQEYLTSDDPFDLIFGPAFSAEQRKEIQSYVKSIRKSKNVDINTTGPQKLPQLFLSKPKPLSEIVKLLNGDANNIFWNKFQLIKPDYSIKPDLLGVQSNREEFLKQLQTNIPDVATQIYTLEELPFAEDLRGFILFKIENSISDNVLLQSAEMNGRDLQIIRNPTTLRRKLLIDNTFICEEKRKSISKAAQCRLEHVCYSIIRRNIVPEGIVIITRDSLEAYKDVDCSSCAANEEDKNEVPGDRRDTAPGVILTKFLAKRVLMDNMGPKDFAFNNDFSYGEQSFIRDQAKTLNLQFQNMKNVKTGEQYTVISPKRTIQELFQLIKDKTDPITSQRYEIVAPKLEQFL